MVRKKLAVAVAAMGALQANLASALGLGDFSLNSALNQPLKAEIKLLNTRDLDNSQIKVSLASKEDFDRAGVSRDYFLTNLKFDVRVDEQGTGTIVVTTHDPVVEPYLNFVVEARWPSGRLLREYTVLLDLPVFSESKAAPVAAATTAAPAQSAAPAAPASAAATVQPSTSPRLTLQQGVLQAGEKYRVRQNDTLWEIAAQSRPGSRVSVQQTMIAIQRLNPSAFINGNINRLKAGYVLRLPTEAEIGDISGGDAIREVAAQNRAWKTGTSVARDTGAAPQLDARSAPAADSDAGYSEQGRLSIATAGDSDAAMAGDGSGAGSAALRSQLDTSLENLDKTQRENEELQGRLNDMESKIATLQRLLELKDDQLAALQGQMADQQTAPEAGADTTPDTGTMDAGSEAGVMADEAATTTDMTSGEAMQTGDEPAAGEPAAMAEAPAPVEQPQPAQPPAPPPPPPAEGPLETILANPLYLAGAGGAVVLLLAAALIMRKRKAAAESDTEELALFEEDSGDVEDVALDSEEFDVDLGSDDEEDLSDQLAAEVEQELAADAAMEEEQPAEAVKSETGDAIAEAEIYIAYGRYQQAIDLLSTAVSQEPDRADLQVKLLEVYLETRDKPAFQQQYMALQALGDEEAVSRVKELLSSVDGAADWLDDLAGPAPDFSDTDMDAELLEESGDEDLSLDDDLDVDLNLDELGATQETPAMALDEGELDLDLELDMEETDDSTNLGATQAMDAVSPDAGDSVEESLELSEEFDLGGDTGESDTLDLSDLDLGDMDTSDEATTAAEAPAMEEPAAEQPATEEGFDLDLEGDDLDLDLGGLGDTDISDLEAEFGDNSPASTPQQPAALDDAGMGEAGDDDFGLSDLAEPEEETLSFDAIDTADLGEEFDLSEGADDGAAGAGSTSEPEPSFELEAEPEPASEPEPPPAASADESFGEAVSSGAPEGDDFDFLADTDEVATKLDLARAYIDMGDTEGAKDILDEVLQEGNDEQKQEASSLMERV